MARSRVGGTSSLLSGKVGDVIYSITRNADGSFRQQISANPIIRENPNTDEQARARCTMGTIERAMFTFRDFIASGWEGVDRGTNSVSEFSRYNYNAIKEYIEFWWDVSGEPELQYNLPKKGQTQPRGGCFRLSQGSISLRRHWIRSYAPVGNPRFMVQSWEYPNPMTLAAWLDWNGMYIGDQLVFVFFEEGRTPSLAKACYFLVATDKFANPNTILTQSNFRSLLIMKSNVGGNITFNPDNNQLTYQFTDQQGLGLIGVSVDGVRLRREVNGKVLYNTCDLSAPYYDPVETWGWQRLSTVKSSWKNS